MLTRTHPDQERMQQLCSLAVLGEITFEDRTVLQKHLSVCRECRELLKDLEHIALVALPAAAASRMADKVEENLSLGDEDAFLSQLLQKARRLHPGGSIKPALTAEFVQACPVPLLKRLRRYFHLLYPIASGVLATLVLLGLWIHARRNDVNQPPVLVSDSASLLFQAEANGWRVRALSAQKQLEATQQALAAAQFQAQTTGQSLAQVSDKYQRLLNEDQSLVAQVAQQDARIRQEVETLTLSQLALNEARADASNLQLQLQASNQRLETQSKETSRLREVTDKAPPRIPSTGSDMDDKDARELLGARDLHIVDVYDVDRTGNESRIYGRVYYVNHQFLLFYAFDLDQSTKNRKPVAFQAWGFRQPQSKTAESVGLFYLEDSKSDRWTLRVSDPRLLARIDTLFVTVEPPGGSTVPQGKQLLMASLGGPPNHP